jgi:hypothetical protein
MMNLVTAVEQFYQDKPVPRLTLLILTDICTSAADGETVNGIASADRHGKRSEGG